MWGSHIEYEYGLWRSKVDFAAILSEDIAPKNDIPFQPPSDLDTRRVDAGRPSKKGLIGGASEGWVIDQGTASVS